MSDKFKSDSDLKSALQVFFSGVLASVARTSGDVKRAMEAMFYGQGANRMVDGYVFEVNRNLEDAHLTIVRRCVHLLGSRLGHEGEISSTLWQAAVSHISASNPSVEASIRGFISSVEALETQPRTYLAPNDLLRFDPPGVRFVVDRVTVISGADAAAEINDRNQNPKWEAVVGDTTYGTDGKVAVGVPQHCWLVTVEAAQGNTEEEALWLANVTLALLRLTTLPTLGQFTPNLGQVEPNPFRQRLIKTAGVTLGEPSIAIGGYEMPPFYQISDATRQFCAGTQFVQIARSVFAPPKSSVAERVSSGLGWLTRGRQAEDRAERFLFFFTAVEALLTSDDKSAPVVQNVARNAASILADEPTERAKLAAQIKRLYGFRSALVHAGARGVTRTSADTIQSIAERLFWRVLCKVDLSQKLVAFHDDLSDCSYGSPWQKGSPDRFDPVSQQIPAPPTEKSNQTRKPKPKVRRQQAKSRRP